MVYVVKYTLSKNWRLDFKSQNHQKKKKKRLTKYYQTNIFEYLCQVTESLSGFCTLKAQYK
jgi:hypothetical protein